MPELTITQMTSSDITLLVALRMEVLSHVFEQEKRGMSEREWEDLAEQNREYYLRELPAGRHLACVAYLGNDVVGCGGVCFQRELPSPDNRSGLCAYLMNIYTRAEFRGSGFARRICEWLIEKARAAGAGKIYLESSADGRALYHSLGFHDMADYMALPTATPA